jgi:hypothetical protein
MKVLEKSKFPLKSTGKLKVEQYTVLVPVYKTSRIVPLP